MYEFSYQRPPSLADVKSALGDGEASVLLAGGMTLIPTMKLRLMQADTLIDLAGVAELRGISTDGDALTLGAMTTHAEVAHSEDVAATIGALGTLAAGIGDAQVRNRGTIGGSLANNDPAADYPAAVLGLGATVVTDQREIAADDFFVGMFETALEPGEIITAVRFPRPRRAAYAKFENPASRYAIVGVFVSETARGIRVAVTGAADAVFRHAGMEAALAADFSADALDAVDVDADHLNDDLHASPEYRAHLVRVMARRAVAAAGD